MKKVYFHNLGCDKNTVNGEILLGDILENGFEITEFPEESDLIIVNTCCFIDSAKEESIEAVLSFLDADLKPDNKIVVTGCMVERYKDELTQELPEVDLMTEFYNPEEIIALFDNNFHKGERYLKNNVYSYLKISEGCNRNCTYCAIPNIKGKHQSFKPETIFNEAKRLENLGVKELILVAQDLTQYGNDLDGYTFKDLLKHLSKEFNFNWIRLLYLYPEGIDEELLNIIKDNKNIIPYFDIPIQHTNDRILKRMGRHITKEEIYKKVDLIRNKLPEAVLRSTVIVGFPSESDSEFMELLEDLKNLQFDRLGAFMYSQEDGTPAAYFDNQISEEVKEKRYNRVNKVQSDIMKEKNKRFIGKVYSVIIEEQIDPNTYGGRMYSDSPEIDNIIYVNSPVKLDIGDIKDVKVINSLDYEFIGDLYESTK